MNLFKKLSIFILIQVLLVSNCVWARQGISLNYAQRDTPAALSPRIQINIPVFESEFSKGEKENVLAGISLDSMQTRHNKNNKKLGGNDDFKKRYMARAQKLFGESIGDELDMDESWQESAERLRLSLLEPFYSGYSPENDFAYPSGDIYVQLTNYCNAVCSFCIVNCGPWNTAYMTGSVLRKIFEPLPERYMADDLDLEVTFGGGEPLFAEVPFAIAHSRYRNSIIITNASSFNTREEAQQLIRDIKLAHQQRDVYKSSPDIEVHIGVSVDDIHPSNLEKIFFLIDALMHDYPKATLFFKIVSKFNDGFWQKQIVEMLNKKKDYKAILIEKENNTSRIYINNDALDRSKECEVEFMPLWRLGRSVFLEDIFFPEERLKVKPMDSIYDEDGKNIVMLGKANILVDGRVVIADSLMSAPVPYVIGDLSKDSWSDIRARIMRDPLFVGLSLNGTRRLFEFMEDYDNTLLEELEQKLANAQEFIYWTLIQPERKIYFTLRFLQKFVQERKLFLASGSNRPAFLDMGKKQLIGFVKELVAKERQKWQAKQRGKAAAAAFAGIQQQRKIAEIIYDQTALLFMLNRAI